MDSFARGGAVPSLLARPAAIPPAPGAAVPCGSAFQPVELPDRPDQRRAAARRWPQMDADMPAATGGQSLEQALHHPGTGAVMIGDVVHQLPALLADFDCAFRRRHLGRIVL